MKEQEKAPCPGCECGGKACEPEPNEKNAAPSSDKSGHAACQDSLLRLAADFDNYKKRVAKESTDAAAIGKREILLKILTLCDTFEIAIPSFKSASPEILKGILMIQTQLKSILSDEGAVPFGEQGEKFDPFRHDAIEFVFGEAREGTIAQVIQRGYSWRGGVLRHATVKVVKSADSISNGVPQKGTTDPNGKEERTGEEKHV